MRLRSRLLALALLLLVAGFTNLVSPIGKADDSACTDGCDNGYNSCIQGCGPGSCSCCTADCTDKQTACRIKCGPLPVEGGVN